MKLNLSHLMNLNKHHINNIMAKYTILRLQTVTPRLRDDINKMVDLFMENGPVVKAFNVTKNRKISAELRNYITEPIFSEGLSFIAIDNATKDAIGLAINHIRSGKDRLEALISEVEDEVEKDLVNYWMLMAKSKISSKDGVFNRKLLVVDPAYSHEGIARVLSRTGLKLAHELNVEYIRAVCTHPATIQMNKSFGYTLEKRIPLESIVNSKGEKIFNRVEAGFSHIEIYVLPMRKVQHTQAFLDYINYSNPQFNLPKSQL